MSVGRIGAKVAGGLRCDFPLPGWVTNVDSVGEATGRCGRAAAVDGHRARWARARRSPRPAGTSPVAVRARPLIRRLGWSGRRDLVATPARRAGRQPVAPHVAGLAAAAAALPAAPPDLGGLRRGGGRSGLDRACGWCRPDPAIAGLTDGEVVSPTALAQRDIIVTTEGDLDSIEVRLNGRPLPNVVNDGSMLHVRLPTLVDGDLRAGDHRRTVARRTGSPRPATSRSTGPRRRCASRARSEPVPIDEPLTLVGTADGAAEVASPGARGGGRRLGGLAASSPTRRPPPSRSPPPTRPGTVPSCPSSCRSAYPKTNGVHVTAKAWADPSARPKILRMITEKRHQHGGARPQGRGRHRRLRRPTWSWPARSVRSRPAMT